MPTPTAAVDLPEPLPEDTRALAEQIVSRASGSEAAADNRIEVLLDSTENFPAWQAAIASACHSIDIEMYIFANNAFGRQIRDLLIEKQQQGVQVRLVYDWFGSVWAHYRGFFRPLRAAGAVVVAYNRPSLVGGIGLISRNHRKSIVIDGHTAFVSGLCISSAWCGDAAKGVAPWRDTGVKLTGPVVQQVSDAFADTLQSQQNNASHTTLNSNGHSYNPHHSGTAQARIVATTPDNGNMMRLDLNAVTLAQENLWITDAYFMPTRLYTQALINAAQAGVDVRLLVPRTSDIRWIGNVSRTQYRSLLEAGVRVFEWNGSMIHAKTAIVDGRWARVGSTNLNLSSWAINRELDVSIEDSATVARLTAVFADDLQHATEVVLNQAQQAELKQRRQKHKQGFKRGSTNALAQRLLQLGHVFDGSIYGTRIVDKDEAQAYLSIGVGLLLLAALLWFLPQLVVYPLLLLLVMSGLATTWSAIKRLRQYRRNPPPIKENDPLA